MSASRLPTAEYQSRSAAAPPRADGVGRLSSVLGWLLISVGTVADLIYHIPILLFGVQWPLLIVTLGEFGHTVILVGIVLVIFAVLRKHNT